MAVPDFQTFMLPLLTELADGKEHELKDLYVTLAQKLNLTEQDKDELLPSGKQRVYHSRIGWARTYLKKAELLHTVKRGRFVITTAGKALLNTNPQSINKKMLEQYPSYMEFLQLSKSSQKESQVTQSQNLIIDDKNELTPTEQISVSFKTIQSELVDELLDVIRVSSPQFFETLVVDLMLAMGYGGWSKESGKATQFSSDGGIDGIINEDPLGLDTIYLQAKRYSENNTVGRPDIQAFSGALDMQRSRKGVFITTSKFSRDALEYVQLIEKKIVLIDGQQLAEMMIKYNLGVSVKDTYQIKTIDTDYFNEDQ
ncbi:MAG: restriction endonuclease [Paraglaciecola sp.]|uniref:restriction endonuclease n=1 Tax=Paraglaciecola sp. TaxID=1920173 RepID=UPI003296A5C8